MTITRIFFLYGNEKLDLLLKKRDEVFFCENREFLYIDCNSFSTFFHILLKYR